MSKPVCPCQISSSGNFYRHHVPDCPNALPSAAPVVTKLPCQHLDTEQDETGGACNDCGLIWTGPLLDAKPIPCCDKMRKVNGVFVCDTHVPDAVVSQPERLDEIRKMAADPHAYPFTRSTILYLIGRIDELASPTPVVSGQEPDGSITMRLNNGVDNVAVFVTWHERGFDRTITFRHDKESLACNADDWKRVMLLKETLGQGFLIVPSPPSLPKAGETMCGECDHAGLTGCDICGKKSAAPPLLPATDNLNTFAVGCDKTGPQPTND